MPISAAKSGLQNSLKKVQKLKKSGNATAIARIMTTAIAKAAAKGLKKVGSSYIPVIPAGITICFSNIKKAHYDSMGKSVDVKKCASLIAKGIAGLTPMVPKIGKAKLQKDIEKAINLQKSGSPEKFASLMATAIINYYKKGKIK